MKKCEQFARIITKNNGMTYAEARRKYPMGPYKGSVYIDNCRTRTDHCVHCARIEAMNMEESK